MAALQVQLRPVHLLASVLFAAIAVVASFRPPNRLTFGRGQGRAVGVLQDAWTIAAIAGMSTVALGFLAHVDLSRRLVLLDALTYAVIAPALMVRKDPLRQSTPTTRTRIGVIGSDVELRQLLETVGGPSEPHGAGARARARGQYEVVIRFVTDERDGSGVRGVLPAALEDLVSTYHEEQLDLVVAGHDAFRSQDMVVLANAALAEGVEIQSFCTFYEQHFLRVPLVSLDLHWFLGLQSEEHEFYRRLQYARDSLAAIVGLLVLAVVLPFVAAAVVLSSGRPVFYRQTRVGVGGCEFEILKFRTMRTDAEATGARFATALDTRVTRVGRVLRKTRLDELPQVVNILRGDMAFVGPRPERPEFVAMYKALVPFYDRRHAIRPGVTGWAQVTEGYTSTLAGTRRKLERDLFYLKHQSAALDMVILLRTLHSMIRLTGQ